MSIDRAWSRRPLVSQPWFGRSLPSTWLETTCTFARIATTTDELGMQSSMGAPVDYYTTNAHVEFHPYESVEDPIQRRIARIFMPFPERSGHLPRRGDQITWTADTGTTYVTHVRTVDSPLNMHDHLQIESEAFE